MARRHQGTDARAVDDRVVIGGINPAVAVRPVDEASRSDWHRTFVDGFATTAEERRLNDELAGVLAHVPDAVHLLADLDGEVAGCGSLFPHGPVGWVSGATLPQSRRQGVQAAMLDARIEIAERTRMQPRCRDGNVRKRFVAQHATSRLHARRNNPGHDPD